MVVLPPQTPVLVVEEGAGLISPPRSSAFPPRRPGLERAGASTCSAVAGGAGVGRWAACPSAAPRDMREPAPALPARCAGSHATQPSPAFLSGTLGGSATRPGPACRAGPSGARWCQALPRGGRSPPGSGARPSTPEGQARISSLEIAFVKGTGGGVSGDPLGPPIRTGYLELVEVTGGSRRETQSGAASVWVASGRARARPPPAASWRWVSTGHLDREAPGQY